MNEGISIYISQLDGIFVYVIQCHGWKNMLLLWKFTKKNADAHKTPVIEGKFKLI